MFLKSFIIFFILIVNNVNSCFGIKMEDTIRINECNNSAREFIIKGDYLKADSLIDKAYNLSFQIDYKKNSILHLHFVVEYNK